MSSEKKHNQGLDKTLKDCITVLYYEGPASLEMCNCVLRDLEVSPSGRVIIPNEFRKGKSIIAVLDGECHILNSLGERVFSQRALE